MRHVIAQNPDIRLNSSSVTEGLTSERTRLLKRMMWKTALFPLILLIATSVFLSWTVSKLLQQARWVEHTSEVIAQAHEGLRLAVDMQTGLRGYQLTGDAFFLQPYQQAGQRLPAHFDKMTRLVSDNPAQVRQLAEIKKSWETWLGHARTIMTAKQAGQNIQSRAPTLQDKALFDGLRLEFQKFIAAEEGLRTKRLAEVQRLDTSLLRYRFLGLLLLGLGLGAFAVWQLQRMSRIFQESENEIRQKAELLKVTLGSIGDAVLATDQTGAVTFLNPEAEKLCGWTSQDAAGQPLEKIFPIFNHDTREPVENPVAKVLRTGQTVSLANHTVLRSRTGREIPITDSGAPIRDGRGNILGVVLVFRDVTQEYAARESLRQSEQRYRTLFELSPSMVVLMDSETGALLDFNESAHKSYGYSREEFQTLHIRDLNAQIDARETQQRLERLRQEGSGRFETLHRTKNGAIRSVFVTTRLVQLDSQPMFLSVWQDVTDIRNAEAALRKNEAELQAIFSNAAVGMVQLDAQTRRFVRANPCFCQITGFSKEELSQMSPEDLTHPDDRKEDSTRLEALWLAGKPYETEKRYIRKDGQVIWVAVSATMLMDEEGRPSRTIAIINDITEQRHAIEALRLEETRLRLALEATELGTWDWDVARDVLVWSPRCKVLFGLDSESEVTYPDFLNTLHPADRAVVARAVEESLDPLGGGKYNLDFRVPQEDGSIRWINSRGQVFFEGEGLHRKPVRFSGTALDITERKRAEQSLRQTQAELERKVEARTHDLSVALSKAQEVDRLKSEFLASMSHELRTPLNSIIGFTEIVLAQIPGPLNEEQRRQLGMSLSSARHLLHLINDLLDLARVESGRVEPTIEEFDPADVIREAIDTIAPLAERKGLVLDELLELPVAIRTDRKMFFQVLLNLLNNAVKFTHHGQVRLETRLVDGELVVSIRDTGIGITAEQMPMLFEAFRQVDGSARKRYEGTGLGLYLCRKLLNLLGGRIWVESEYGKSSVFTFTIPLEFSESSARLVHERGENTANRG